MIYSICKIIFCQVKISERGDAMPFDFGAFFNSLKEARFGFADIGEWISSVYSEVLANTTLVDIWNGGVSSLSGIAPYLLLIFLLGSLVIAFFGKKLSAPIKFLTILVVAFCLGTCYISPLLDPFIVLPHWIMGLMVGAVAAVLYKFVYVALVISVIGYSVYMTVYRADVLTALFSENAVMALIIAVVVLLLLFIFRKYTEMVGFAVFGSWLSAVTVRALYDYTAWLGDNGAILIWIFTAVISVPAIIVQFKMRKKF